MQEFLGLRSLLMTVDAVFDLRDIALGHDVFPLVAGEGFQDYIDVGVAAGDPENRGAPHAGARHVNVGGNGLLRIFGPSSQQIALQRLIQ